MIPSTLSPYLSYVGLFILFVGMVFAVIATTDYKTKSGAAGSGDMLSATKYSVLSYCTILTGGFILLSSSK